MIYNKLNTGGKIILSFDDYSEHNIRLAKLLNKYNLRATFFVETLTKDYQDQIKELNDMGFTIGGHTITHPSDLKALPVTQVKSEIETCKKAIENITGKECKVFAYPRGRYNDQVKLIVRSCEFDEARTTRVLHTKSDDPLALDTTVHVYDGRTEYDGRTWLEMAEFYLDSVIKSGGDFHLWGHANEINRDKQWNKLEQFFEHITKYIERRT